MQYCEVNALQLPHILKTMEKPQGQAWTKENLTKALNTAIAVELFTIPVYLGAATSIKVEDRPTKSIKASLPDNSGKMDHLTEKPGTQEEYFAPYDVIMSVAVQEMFHLTMACNIANALGVRPDITAPDLDNPPSCLKGIIGMPVKGNLSELIDTMLAIEAPDPNYSYDEDPTNPVSANGPKLYFEQYDSIGDLYHALAYGVEAMWDEMYDSSNDAYAKTNFEAKYPEVKATIQTLQDAWNGMACITEQGEGNGAEGFMPAAYEPAEGQQYQELDEISHWERFNDIKTFLTGGGKIPQYTGTAAGSASVQNDLTEDYSKVINQMNTDFSTASKPLNLRGMSQTASLATTIWQGGYVPQWNYIANPTPWKPIPKDAHVCQGLNMCAGQGYNKSGTKPGDGDCATSEQGCYTTNVCKGLGACGYVPTGSVPQPGQNDCSGQGGCQSPISPCQAYPTATKTYGGQAVWDVARQLFKEKLIKEGKLAEGDDLPKITKEMPRRHTPELVPTNGKDGTKVCPMPSTTK